MITKNKTGCLIDISRFRVPTIDRMKIMLSNLSKQGHSIVIFNIEHVFKTDIFPKIGSEADGYTESEFREIDEYAKSHAIEIIPSFQSFGHMFHILKWDEYKSLSETDARWSISISDESYDFLEKYFKIITRTFNSKYLHIGGDEVYDLSEGKSKNLLKNKTKNQLFYEHIITVKKIANKYGKEVLIWGDMIEKDREILSKLGNEVGIGYWMYDLKELPEAYLYVKNDIYVCAGNNTWKGFFPRIKYAIKNMSLMFEYYKKLNAYAYIITDWGDGGHFHSYSITEKLAELGRDIFNGNNPSGLELGDEKINKLVDKMDDLHYGEYLNATRLNNENVFFTQLLFHEYIFTGSAFADQKDEQLELILDRISEIKKLDDEIKWKSNPYMSNEFISDLRLFIDKTYILGKKVKIHLDYRKKKPNNEIQDEADDLIISLRKWFSVFIKRWLDTSQPMGIYFHIHFMKMFEINTINEMKIIKENKEYTNIKKRHIYDIPEFTNIREVCNINGLNEFWKNYRL